MKNFLVASGVMLFQRGTRTAFSASSSLNHWTNSSRRYLVISSSHSYDSSQVFCSISLGQSITGETNPNGSNTLRVADIIVCLVMISIFTSFNHLRLIERLSSDLFHFSPNKAMVLEFTYLGAEDSQSRSSNPPFFISSFEILIKRFNSDSL
ncbi:hypothetical protein AVEN_220197-1 [Araneus ventricosus]|uniref:Uncharacterized protein n=1 Tax=Araneus ventricosus TaxID=182803 RepID=A0A4Y2GWW9_ARAVE|nr:hypothetical protein AVEN_220197-1 [Araneus ventricosus]